MAIIIALAVVVVAIGVALFLLRRRPAAPVAASSQPWTVAAGDEFTALSESGRCEMAFALSALDDVDSLNVLERALFDPSETVGLAAAHALLRRGERGRLDDYFAAHPGDRARRLQQTLTLLDAGA